MRIFLFCTYSIRGNNTITFGTHHQQGKRGTKVVVHGIFICISEIFIFFKFHFSFKRFFFSHHLVKFLPQTNDNLIVSGAGDYQLEVREVSSGEATQVCTCHSERVKRIAIVPSDPHLFFSASEDGTVMYVDIFVFGHKFKICVCV